MKKLTVLSLALLLTIGLFVTGCQKKEVGSDINKKPEVKAPAENATEAPVEKADKPSADK
ncbi:MAG: hypothetical protein ABIH92_05290 [Nanoarchaeota archaeon]